MAYAITNEYGNDDVASGTTIAQASVVMPANGTVIVFAVAGGDDITAAATCSDGTNTYTRRVVLRDPTGGNWLSFVAENVAAGTRTVTVSYTGAARINRGIYVAVVSGLAAISYQTGAAAYQAAPGTGSNGITTGNMTPTAQPALQIGIAANPFSLFTPTAGTGFTSLAGRWQFGSGTDLMRPQHRRLTSGSAIPATWTAGIDNGHASLALVLSEPTDPGVAAVGMAVSGTGSGTAVTSAGTSQATGSTFYIFVVWGTGAFTSVVDNYTNSYSLVGAEQSNASSKARLYKCVDGVGGATHNATATIVGGQCTVFLIEVVGVETSNPVDQSDRRNDSASPFTLATGLTTTQANELLLTFIGSDSGSNPATFAETGLGSSTIEAEQTNGATLWAGAVASAYKTATGTFNPSWTSTGAGNGLVFLETLKEIVQSGITDWFAEARVVRRRGA